MKLTRHLRRIAEENGCDETADIIELLAGRQDEDREPGCLFDSCIESTIDSDERQTVASPV